MVNKVRVYGKAQNRTALGIVKAFLVMYPHATLQDLRKAFPAILANQDEKGELFETKQSYKQKTGKEAEVNFWFLEPDEVLKLQDGTQVIFQKMWTKESFEKLVSHAANYGIEIAQFEEGVRGVKGGYRLEYLNGYVPPKPKAKKTSTAKVVGITLASLLAITVPVFKLLLKKPKVVEVEKVVVVHDTLYVQALQQIEKDFNAAEFEQGKAVLSEDAKFVLHDLARLLNQYPELRLRIEGHTSQEGNADFNKKLSEKRAKVAVDFLVNHENIDASRLKAVGKGSSQLKNTADPYAKENRRTEFIVIE